MPNDFHTGSLRGDLTIPAMSGATPVRSSYRAQRPGLEPGTKYLLMAAAGLGAVLLAGMGSWAVMGSRSTVVPVIEADTRPLRVKPENAGGLQVAGADDQVMGGQGSATQGMAPTAEVPAPQALRAQMQPAGPLAPPSAATQAAPAVPPAVAPARPVAQAARPAVPQPVSGVTPASRVTPASGVTMVQLAAVTTEQAAQTEWQRLAKRMPDLLGDRQPVVQKADRDGQAVWRVRTSGFADIADAAGFCARVRSKGSSCSIASF